MAIGEGFEGTESGIGQGLAYVLPEGKSQHYALQLAQEDSKRQAAQAAATIKRKQQLQDKISSQFAAQKLDPMWSPYNKAISDANNAWQTKAAQYNASTGKSPFTNPDLMNEYNQNVKGLALQSKELGDNYTRIRGIAEADGGNKFTPESVQAVIDHENFIRNNPIEALKVPIPKLQPASATFDDLTKVIKPVSVETKNGYQNTTVPDRSAHIDQAVSTVLNNPDKWAPLLQKQFGVDITKPTFPMVGKNGRKVYSTNDATVSLLADKTIESPDGPVQLAEFGIKPDDPYAKEKLMDVIKTQNSGFGKYLTQVADNADAKVKRSSAVSFEADNHARAVRGEQRAITRFNERNTGSSDVGSAQSITIPYANGKANVQLNQYVPISVSKKNFAGSPYIDLATGKDGGKLASSNDYEIVGVGNAPFIKDGPKKGAISQPGYAESDPNNIQHKPIVHVQVPAKGEFGKPKDYFIPYDRLPENVKNSKPIKSALSKFKPASESESKQTGTVTMVLPNGQTGQIPSDKVEDFIKKYPRAKRQ